MPISRYKYTITSSSETGRIDTCWIDQNGLCPIACDELVKASDYDALMELFKRSQKMVTKDPSKVIEAVRKVVTSESVAMPPYHGTVVLRLDDISNIADAITAYDNKETNILDDNYKWLSSDVRQRLWKEKPEWTGFTSTDKWWGVEPSEEKKFVHVDNPPSWLRAGQLWERGGGYQSCGDGYFDTEYNWDGYEWRLVEDHSQFENSEQDNPWITDRRPTKDDAWNGEVVNGYGHIYFEDWDAIEPHEPWQPIPHCLRVKPEQPGCETCAHVDRVSGHSDVLVCCHLMRLQPTYGMEGCNYRRRYDEYD